MMSGWWRRGGLALHAGSALFLLLVVSSVASLLVDRGELGRMDRVALRYQPPHVGPLRAALWRAPADSGCQIAFAGSTNCAATDRSPIAGSAPPIARIDRAYRFAPRFARDGGSWQLLQSPAGFEIDPVTGVVTGTPTTTGAMTLALSVTRGDSVWIHATPFWVEDRFLPLGSDRRGDDLLLLLLLASPYVLLPGLLLASIGVGGGVLIGAFAGFYGGFARTVLGAATSALQSIPGLLLLFVAVKASGFSLLVTTITAGLILLPEIAQGIMERVEFFRRRDFVESARELGLRDRTILWNEIVWHNGRDFIANRTAVAFTFGTLMDITLGYLGFANEQRPSLGLIGRNGRAALMAGESSGEAVTAMTGLLLVMLTCTLLDRGIRASWGRRQ